MQLQEQAAKKLSHLVKIMGKVNTVDLTTKHLSNATIPKHHQNLRHRHTSVRADAAANLHALHPRAQDKTGKVDRRLRSKKADVDNAKEFSGAPRGDHWSG